MVKKRAATSQEWNIRMFSGERPRQEVQQEYVYYVQ